MFSSFSLLSPKHWQLTTNTSLLTPISSPSICRYTKSMKTLVSVFAGSPRDYAFEPLFAGKSAFDRVIEWINDLSSQDDLHLHQAVVFTTGEYIERIEAISKNCLVPVQVCSGDFSSVAAFIAALESVRGDCDTIIHGRYSCPFYDPELTTELYQFHHRYAAEYTFAEGWPEGLAPVVVKPDMISKMAST